MDELVLEVHEHQDAKVLTRNRKKLSNREFFRWKPLTDYDVAVEGMAGLIMLRVFTCVHEMRPDYRILLLRAEAVGEQILPVYTGIVDIDGTQLQFVDPDKFRVALIAAQELMESHLQEWEKTRAQRKPRPVRQIRLEEVPVVETAQNGAPLTSKPFEGLRGLEVKAASTKGSKRPKRRKPSVRSGPAPAPNKNNVRLLLLQRALHPLLGG